MVDSSFNGMSAVRHAAVEILERIRREYAGFTPSREKAMLLEDAIVDVLEQHKENIYRMRLHEYDLEDADNFIRGRLGQEEEYDENGNRILLDEKWLCALIDATGDVFDAELGTWDNFENGFDSLYNDNPEFVEWYKSLPIE